MKLGVSAELIGSYLSIQIEYGDDQVLRPELVNLLRIALKNNQDVLLREWSLDCATFENSDGVYRSGTILSPQENPSLILVSAQVAPEVLEVLGGPNITVQAQAPVLQKRNQITTNHF